MNSKLLNLIFCLFLFACAFTAYAQKQNPELKSRISNYAAAIHLTKTDIDNCVIVKDYTDNASGIEHVYLQQAYRGIKVLSSFISLAFKEGKLVYSSGKFINDIARVSPGVLPSVQAADAINKAAMHLGLKPQTNVQKDVKEDRSASEKKILFKPGTIAKSDIETELFWVQDSAGTLHLAWNVKIDVVHSLDVWEVSVDAFTGKVLSKYNHLQFDHSDEGIVNHCPEDAPTSILKNANRVLPIIPLRNKAINYLSPPEVKNASYTVIPFPYGSLNYGPISVETNPWLKAGANNNATTYGWHFDGTNNYIGTRGNNVWAFISRNEKILSDSTDSYTELSPLSPTYPDLTFNFLPDLSKSPYYNPNAAFSVTNIFYWCNIIHDIMYQYGFTEAGANFQANNMGRGDLGKDGVFAWAQFGGWRNNAYALVTTPDGFPLRLYMGIADSTRFLINTPSSIAGEYPAQESSLSSNNRLFELGPVTGQVVFYDDPGSDPPTHSACDSTRAPVHDVTGKIAFINGSTCDPITRMRSAQKAGARGVIFGGSIPDPVILAYYNKYGNVTFDDDAITIPAVMVGIATGLKIAAEIPNGVSVTMFAENVKDGGLDNEVICHEYGHGISGRSNVGGTNIFCISGHAETPWEGLSDYFALMLTTDWANAKLTDGAKGRPFAAYYSGDSAKGWRRVPYTTNMAVDTVTYASMDGNITGNGEIHRIGEIWCSALWDMTWNIIQQQGAISPDLYNSSAAGGNIIALKLVMEGLRLMPCQPGFIDSRNALLAADTLLFNGANSCSIWSAFARRGMGVSAVQGLSTSTSDQVPAFDMPSACRALPLTLLDFTVRKLGAEVALQWKTASEVNTKDFEIERSREGAAWQSIGSVDAKGAGDNEYTYYDRQPLNGKNFYRLKMKDKDGKFTYSPVRVIDFAGGVDFTIVPNPATDNTTLRFTGDISGSEIVVTDMQGRVQQRYAVNNTMSSYTIETNRLAGGTYVIKLQLNTGNIITKKLVVSH